MSTTALERRVAALEEEVAKLKHKVESTEPWWERIAGSFENDPVYEKAMQHGRQYRQSLRPRTSRKKP